MDCLELKPSYLLRDQEILKALIKKIYSIPRSMVQFLFSAGLTVLLLAACGNGPYMAPLVIFSGILTLFFFYLLTCCLFKRPKLLKAVTREKGEIQKVFFYNDNLEIISDSVKYALPYKDIIGQYWYEDRYILYIDGKKFQGFFSIIIDKDSFDDILSLAQFLEHNNKKKLYQIKSKWLNAANGT